MSVMPAIGCRRGDAQPGGRGGGTGAGGGSALVCSPAAAPAAPHSLRQPHWRLGSLDSNACSSLAVTALPSAPFRERAGSPRHASTSSGSPPWGLRAPPLRSGSPPWGLRAPPLRSDRQAVLAGAASGGKHHARSAASIGGSSLPAAAATSSQGQVQPPAPQQELPGLATPPLRTPPPVRPTPARPSSSSSSSTSSEDRASSSSSDRGGRSPSPEVAQPPLLASPPVRSVTAAAAAAEMPSLQKLSSASVDRRSPRDKGTWLPSQRPPSQRPPPDGPQQRRPGPSLALQRQQRQQLEHQQQLQQQLYRQQRLRVPYWVRSLASEFLQVMVPAGAAASAAGPAGAFAEPPAEVMQRLAALLPPYQESREQAARRLKQQQADAAAAVEERQQQAAAAADEQQQAATLDNLQEEQAGEQGRQGKENRQQVQQQAEQHLPPPPQQQQAPAAARGSGAGAGSVFAAELAQILRHYEESSAVAAPEGAAPDPQPAPAAAGSCAKQRRTAMGPFATPATPVSGRGRHLDEGGFVLLLRAVALMGDGIRSGLALLLAADRAPGAYPTRSPAAFSALLRLANTLMEDEASMRLLRLAQEWGVPLDRPMYHKVLDVKAKVGKAGEVQQLMEEMAGVGLEPNAVAHTILLMAHEKAGDWEAVLGAYDNMRRRGLERNSFTYRAVVSSLVSAGRLDAACEVLDWMREDGVEGNAVVHQVLINAFLERGQQDKVDWLLGRMVVDGVRFSHQAVSRLTAFSLAAGQPKVAYRLFKKVRDLGLLSWEDAEAEGREGSEDDEAPPTGAAVSSEEDEEGPTGALGSASASDDEDAAAPGSGDARALERQRRHARAQASFCYGRMIAACQKARLLDEAWCIYQWMQQDGLRPDRATYSRLISVCAYAPHLGSAEGLYARLLAEGHEVDAFMYLHLVQALGSGEAGPERWPTVLRVLHALHMQMPNYKDTHVQTVAASLAAKQGQLGQVLGVYRLMLQDGVQPSTPTFNALIAACMRTGHPAHGFRFFEVMQSMGVEADVVTVSTLITCCERMNDWRRAQEVWDWMLAQGLPPDTVCYSTMISCLERCNEPARALEVFERMQTAGAPGPGAATYATLCDMLAKQGKWDRLRTAVQVREWMESQGEDTAQVTYAQVAQRAAEGGQWQCALDLFDGMKGSLRRRSSEPNGVTYCAAIIACARLADWRRALELKDQMLARGLPSQSIVYNSVLAACEASQQLEVALDVLGEMRAKDVARDCYTYSTLLSACATHDGGTDTAMRLFEEMQAEGLTPNIFVMNALLSVHSAAGDASAAERVFSHISEALQLQPDVITMQCMMEAMGRAGHWADGLRYFVASYEQFGSRYQQEVMQLDLGDPETAALLDLHYLTVLGSSIVLRAWLLYLRRSAQAGVRLPPGATVSIVTGWGRNSPSRVPRLKPEVARILREELGPPLELSEPPRVHSGVYHVQAEALYDWLLHHAQLGYTAEEEDQAWALMQRLRELQASEHRRASAAPTKANASGGASAGPVAEADPAALEQRLEQQYERIEWARPPGGSIDASQSDSP